MCNEDCHTGGTQELSAIDRDAKTKTMALASESNKMEVKQRDPSVALVPLLILAQQLQAAALGIDFGSTRYPLAN